MEIITVHKAKAQLSEILTRVEAGEKIILANFTPLPVAVRHGQFAGSLPGPHRDPFDRMSIVQAIRENLVPMAPRDCGEGRVNSRDAFVR